MQADEDLKAMLLKFYTERKRLAVEKKERADKKKSKEEKDETKKVQGNCHLPKINLDMSKSFDIGTS